MAHYALLDENNIVTQVITGVDETVIQIDLDGTQIGGSSDKWEEFYAKNLNASSCKKTSYNSSFSKNYAGIGYMYDETRDAFIPPKPYSSWILQEETCIWKAPVDYPNDGNFYIWDETKLIWKEITENAI